MSHGNGNPKDARLQEAIARAEHEDSRINHYFRRTLHLIERCIAVITIVFLIYSLGYLLYEMIGQPGHMVDSDTFLHHILSIVVGLEFVRMLIDTTPASILEVLTVAITRHVILSHDDPWSNLACVACIAGLFAIRRYLIRRSELKEEMVEMD